MPRAIRGKDVRTMGKLPSGGIPDDDDEETGYYYADGTEDLGFEPSKYQSAIFDFVKRGRGNGFVNAKAGSGKTTTLVCCAKMITGLGIFCAFNRHIADELGKRLRGTSMSCSTIHSIGNRAIRSQDGLKKVKLNDRKYFQLARDLVESATEHSELDGTDLDPLEVDALREEWPVVDLNKLCTLTRISLVDESDDAGIYALAGHHGMDFHEKIYPLVPKFIRMMMRAGIEPARRAIDPQRKKRGRSEAQLIEFDFADMLWFPCKLNLKCNRYPWVFVDEAQDLNKAQLELVKKSVAPGGRVLFVGDPNQAIYGFAGADSNSVRNIQLEMKTTEMPLSVCYRCPESHIRLAQALVPDIEARPGAPEGDVVNLPYPDKVLEVAEEGDLILCRLTAPLLGLCYKLIASGISAAVKGRDIGKGLVKVVETISESGSFKRFPELLDEWEGDQIQRLQGRKGDIESAIGAIQDKAECLNVMYGAAKPQSYSDLIDAIERLFASDRPSVLLSTVHRAKGLENKRVFILKPELMPFYRATMEWQIQQELNLKYVAFTRAKETMFMVSGDDDYARPRGGQGQPAGSPGPIVRGNGR